MGAMVVSNADLNSLRREVAALRLELADFRMRALLNSFTFDFGLMLTAACLVFVVAMKLT